MSSISVPYEWEELSDEERARIQSLYPVSFCNDLLRANDHLLMSRTFISVAERVYNFPVKEDDIWIVTFPKVGTTWTQEMVWMLVNDVDKEKGAVPLSRRSPFLEFAGMVGDKGPEDWPIYDTIEMAMQLPGRRVIKSHLPMEFLPPNLHKQCKVIYVARNPKDACVSYFHHMRDMPGHGFVGDFADFAENFKDGLQLFGDYWHHIKGGWNLKDEPNVKFIWYEDMKVDQRKVINDLCVFLDHPLSPELVDQLVEHLKFDNMKSNVSVNPTSMLNMKKGNFIRKGQVGDWKNFFTPEKENEWAEWMRKNTQDCTELQQKIYSFLC